VSDADLAERAMLAAPARQNALRGYDWLHARYITQAYQGCDFSFLRRDGAG